MKQCNDILTNIDLFKEYIKIVPKIVILKCAVVLLSDYKICDSL